MPPPVVSELTIRVDKIFDAARQSQLRVAFGLAPNDDLRPTLEGLATAALNEYSDTFFGDGMPTRAEDFQQRRLLQLLLHVFGRLPNERQVATLFRLPLSRARSLLNGVIIRFGERLRAKIDEDVRRVLASDFEGRTNYRNVMIWSTATRQAIDDMVDELNRQKSKGPYFDKLSRHPTINGCFEIGTPTLAALKEKLQS